MKEIETRTEIAVKMKWNKSPGKGKTVTRYGKCKRKYIWDQCRAKKKRGTFAGKFNRLNEAKTCPGNKMPRK